MLNFNGVKTLKNERVSVSWWVSWWSLGGMFHSGHDPKGLGGWESEGMDMLNWNVQVCRQVPVTILILFCHSSTPRQCHRCHGFPLSHILYALRNLESNRRAYYICVRINCIPIGTISCSLFIRLCPTFFFLALVTENICSHSRVHVSFSNFKEAAYLFGGWTCPNFA